MRPSAYGLGTQLAVWLELREDRLPQALLPGNLLDIQHGSYRVRAVLDAQARRSMATTGVLPPFWQTKGGFEGCSTLIGAGRLA